MNNECKAIIEKLEKELFDLQEQQNSKEDFRKHIEETRRVLTTAQKDAANGFIPQKREEVHEGFTIYHVFS